MERGQPQGKEKEKEKKKKITWEGRQGKGKQGNLKGEKTTTTTLFTTASTRPTLESNYFSNAVCS